MVQIPTPIKKSMFAGVITLTLTFVAGEEGVRNDAYLDIVGIPTICYGDTENVKIGQHASQDECVARLNTRIKKLIPTVSRIIGRSINEQSLAALSAFCDNVGINACRNSEAMKRVAAGDTRKGCDLLLNWTRAKDKRLALYGRRMRERALCLVGDDISHGLDANIDQYQKPPQWFVDRVGRWGLKARL